MSVLVVPPGLASLVTPPSLGAGRGLAPSPAALPPSVVLEGPPSVAPASAPSASTSLALVLPHAATPIIKEDAQTEPKKFTRRIL